VRRGRNHIGASAEELRTALEEAMIGIFDKSGDAP
jgi:hypothetical protein